MGNFPDYTLYFQNYNWWVLFIHEKFLDYKLKTFKNCKEVKHIMIMIIAIIYILSYVIFDQRLKITFRKSSAPSPLKKPTPSFLLILPLKIQKLKVPPSFCQHWHFFSPLPLPAESKGGHCAEYVLLKGI